MPSRETGRLPRRTLIAGAASAAASSFVAGGLRLHSNAVARAQTPTPDIDWTAFDTAVRDGMQTFELVGAAIAIVTADGIDQRAAYGVRDLTGGAPVTPDTHFLVGSTTKSMSSLLVATLVDDGALAWDQPAREVWPDFRAPSDALTRESRVRDLFGMASGIGEPASTVLHFGASTAAELLRRCQYRFGSLVVRTVTPPVADIGQCRGCPTSAGVGLRATPTTVRIVGHTTRRRSVECALRR